jgi:hypothetical protein
VHRIERLHEAEVTGVARDAHARRLHHRNKRDQAEERPAMAIATDERTKKEHRAEEKPERTAEPEECSQPDVEVPLIMLGCKPSS